MASSQNPCSSTFRHSFQHPLTHSHTSAAAAAGKVSKRRKSRASKRNHTTFIAADPANFRHMVHQVTGLGFAHSPPVFKPDPHRPAGHPPLDTSTFLLNGTGSGIAGPGFRLLINNALIGSDFDAFSSFPTLESWKAVM